MFRKFMFSISLIMVLFLTADCNKKMADSDFVELYARMALATEKHAGTPEKMAEAHLVIFHESGFTSEEFREFEDRYRDTPEKWLKIWQKIVKEIQRKRKAPALEDEE